MAPSKILAENIGNSLPFAGYKYYFLAIYLLGSAPFFFRLIGSLVTLLKRIHRNPQIKIKQATVVLVDEKVLPHTFLNYIFVNKEDYENRRIEQELFTHELAHVREKHSMDVLLIELFQIIFWFNPILIFIRKSICLNHEFIADQEVINKHKNISEYQGILLALVTGGQNGRLSSNINYSLTKKRFKMMVKYSSRLSKRLARLALIPLTLVLIFLFADITVSNEDHGTGHSKEHTDANYERAGPADKGIEKRAQVRGIIIKALSHLRIRNK